MKWLVMMFTLLGMSCAQAENIEEMLDEGDLIVSDEEISEEHFEEVFEQDANSEKSM